MRMLRDNVGPGLRAEGFKGSGREYTMPSAIHWRTLGFQGSTANTAGQMKFTVNCKVVRRDLWAATYEEKRYIGVRPKPNVHVGIEWWNRIGQLMPDRTDRWWSLNADDDSSAVAQDVLTAIRSHAIPAMLEECARSS